MNLAGPKASWIEDDDEHVLNLSVRSTAEELALRLEKRATLIRLDDVDIDDVLSEIKSQIAYCAASGDYIGASDLADTAFSLISAKENARRWDTDL